MNLPTLYKKTSKNKIQQWKIWTEENVIYSESGQVDGKKILSQDTIREGKNIGKVNETTPNEQAATEALAKWTSKKKKGYVESIKDAENGVVDKSVVKGGLVPMTAKDYTKRTDKAHVQFPCAAQPKLDGIRAIWHDGKLWTRSRKEIISVPHVVKALQEHFPDVSLDGELYNHDFKDDFEKITHIVNQKKKPVEGHEIVNYHIYDVINEDKFIDRNLYLNKFAVKLNDVIISKIGVIDCISPELPLKLVQTSFIENKDNIDGELNSCLDMGYEGLMIRNLNSPYEQKRSKHLQKYKLFDDAEFKIVGINEGRGKLIGHAGSFKCVMPNSDNTFDAKLKGDLSKLKEYFENKSEYIGKTLTVQFQGYTNKNGLPRFPVALRFREEN